MAIGGLVANLAVPSVPNALFTLVSNPNGFFKVQGSTLVQAINTPPGQYPISLLATGIATPQNFILLFGGAGGPALLVDGTDDALLVDDVDPALTVGG